MKVKLYTFIIFGILVIAGLSYFIYWILLAPIPKQENKLKPPTINYSGNINVLPVNKDLVSDEELKIIHELFSYNNFDITRFRFETYNFDDISKTHIIGATYVMNGLPIGGSGFSSVMIFNEDKTFDTMYGFDDDNENTANDQDLIKTSITNIPKVTPETGYKIAIKQKVDYCPQDPIFESAKEQDLQMELMYYAFDCVSCKFNDFNNLPYGLALVWNVTYVSQRGSPSVIIDALNGEVIHVSSSIIDCGGI